MGRAPCCDKVGLKKGPWSTEEDELLTQYIQTHGEGQWRSLPKKAGLLRCGKSCRLRWMNYLRPDIKRGNISPEEDDLIIKMHSLLGNKWSLIAARLPGRTDNEVKNYWNTHLGRKVNIHGKDSTTQKKEIENEAQKKRKKKNTEKRKISIKRTKTNVEPDDETNSDYKIYCPKPIKAKPFMLSRNEDSFNSNLVSASGCSSRGNAGGSSTETEDFSPLRSFEEVAGEFLIAGEREDSHNNVFSGSEFECQSHDFTMDNTLDRLYEEYLQLLKTDDEQKQLDEWFL